MIPWLGLVNPKQHGKSGLFVQEIQEYDLSEKMQVTAPFGGGLGR